MRTRVLLVVLGASLLVSAASFAQRTNSPGELQTSMKTIDGAIKAATKAIAAGDFAGAKSPVSLARQTLAATAPFWTQMKVDRAAKLTKDAIRTLDDLDADLSHQTDAAQVEAALSAVSTSCATCHSAYREADGKNGYRVKLAQKAGQGDKTSAQTHVR